MGELVEPSVFETEYFTGPKPVSSAMEDGQDGNVANC